MNKKLLVSALLSVLSMVAVACGSSGSAPSETSGDEATTSTAKDEATTTTEKSKEDNGKPETSEGESDNSGSDQTVETSKTELGEILIDGEGLTLYGFAADKDGIPTCADDCAAAWPAVIVEGNELPEGLDPEVFSLVEGVDGGMQLKAGDWPLYYFAEDKAPGDLKGQGAFDAWYVVSPTGKLVKN